jgi:hypothetical protein
MERKPFFSLIFHPFLNLFIILGESITKSYAANKRFFSPYSELQTTAGCGKKWEKE